MPATPVRRPLARPLAIVTGASSGIGLELARCAAKDNCDLIVAADEPLADTVAALSRHRVEVLSVEADLATREGIDALLAAAGDRPVDILVANAGQSQGGMFLDQPFESWRHAIDTNVTFTLLLLQAVAREMAARDRGRILITGSIAGYVPGPWNAVYNSTKAFIDIFADALGEELADTGVTVTCLKPGATETGFFDRAGMRDTLIGQAPKADPAAVARTGWQAMKDGKRSIVHGWLNQAQVTGAKLAGGGIGAALHAVIAKPR